MNAYLRMTLYVCTFGGNTKTRIHVCGPVYMCACTCAFVGIAREFYRNTTVDFLGMQFTRTNVYVSTQRYNEITPRKRTSEKDAKMH